MKAIIVVVVSDTDIIMADILHVIVLLVITIVTSITTVIATVIAIVVITEVCYVLKSFFVCIVVEWKHRRAPLCP